MEPIKSSSFSALANEPGSKTAISEIGSADIFASTK